MEWLVNCWVLKIIVFVAKYFGKIKVLTFLLDFNLEILLYLYSPQQLLVYDHEINAFSHKSRYYKDI